MVRAALLMAAEERLPFLIRVADGLETRMVVSEGKLREVQPSIAESVRAVDTMFKYGVGTQDELTGKDGEPLLLTQAERMERLGALVRKMRG